MGCPQEFAGSVGDMSESININPRRKDINALIKMYQYSPGGVAQWIECQPVNQTVAGSIPSQGTCLRCKPDPQWGACKRQPHIDVSLLLFLPPFPSL